MRPYRVVYLPEKRCKAIQTETVSEIRLKERVLKLVIYDTTASLKI